MANTKIFKTNKPINSIQHIWSNIDIPIGTYVEQVNDTKNIINPMNGITVKVEGFDDIIGVPYEFITPLFEYKTTILLLHGFNSGPGNKERVIKEWLDNNNLSNEIVVVAPKLAYSPNEAVKQIAKLIQENYGNIFVIGTSLGGFYANYVRALNSSDAIKVHALNPSWSPSITLKKEVLKPQTNLKTNEKWDFTDASLNYIANFEQKCKEQLKHYKGNYYTLHIANFDEVLEFSEMLDYIETNEVPNKLFYYDTDHQFGKVIEMLENIKCELIPT